MLCLVHQQQADGEKLSTLVTASNYGDYIDYPVDLDDNPETNDWKIFYKGKDSEGKDRIFIITAEYVKNEKTSAARTAAGMSENDDYYAFWDQSSVPEFKDGWNTHSDLFMATGYDLSQHKNNPNSRCTSNLLDTANWTSFLDKSDGSGYGQLAIGGPTLEMWCDSWNKYLAKKPKEGFTYIRAEGTNTTGYYVSSDHMEDSLFLYMNGSQERMKTNLTVELQVGYSLYFPRAYGYARLP